MPYSSPSPTGMRLGKSNDEAAWPSSSLDWVGLSQTLPSPKEVTERCLVTRQRRRSARRRVRAVLRLKTLLVVGLATISILACGARYTYEPPNSGSDGTLVGEDFFSAEASCDMTPKGVVTASVNITAGDRFYALKYNSYMAFLRFDIPDLGETIESDTLYIYVKRKQAENFGTLVFTRYNSDWYPLDDSDWFAGGVQIKQFSYAGLPTSETWIRIPNTGLTQGQILPIRIFTTFPCNDLNKPTADRYITFRSVDSSDTPDHKPYLAVNTVSGKRHIFGPMVSHEPTANPMVKVTSTR